MTNLAFLAWTDDTDDMNSVRQDLETHLRTSLVDLVAKQLRAQIFSGKYLPGEKLVVRVLSETLGVSHTPVKDALNRLITEGLVEAIPNKSMIVRRFTNEDLIDNIGMRLMCELFMAEDITVAARQDAALLPDMRKSWECMGGILASREGFDPEQWVMHETSFHRRYMKICGNSKLVRVYNSLDVNRFTYFAYLGNERKPLKRSSFEQNHMEHEEIINALASGSAVRFAYAAIQHLSRACQDYAVDELSEKRIEKTLKPAQRFFKAMTAFEQ